MNDNNMAEHELLRKVLDFQDFILNWEAQCDARDEGVLDNVDGALIDLLDYYDPDGSKSEKLLRDGNFVKECE